MKLFPSLLVLGIAAANSASRCAAQEDTYYELAPQTISIALTLKSNAPGTFELDPETGKQIIDPDTKKPIPTEFASYSTTDKNGNTLKEVSIYSTKVVSSKYGNAQLLQELAEGGVLPDGVASGWQLLAVSDGQGYVLIARKLNQEDFPLDITIATDVSAAYAETSKMETRYKYVPSEDTWVDTVTGSLAGTAEGIVEVDFNGISLVGGFSESFTGFSDLLVSKGAKLSGLVGIVPRGEPGTSFAAGTVSIGPGRAIPMTP